MYKIYETLFKMDLLKYIDLKEERFVKIFNNLSWQEIRRINLVGSTAQKMITNFFSKCDQIRSFFQIWSHLLKKSVMKNLIFCAVQKRDLLPVGLKSSWGVSPPFARLENMPPSLGSFARLIIWSHSSSVKKFGISRKE